MPLVKPFRALRFDPAVAGPLDTLVSPPHDVISPAELADLVARNPHNIVRLLRPHQPGLAAERLRDWRANGVLVREEDPAVWLLEEDYSGPDGVARRRRAIVARVRVEPYDLGRVLRHERTFDAFRTARLNLLRATRTKLSPILLLHDGRPPPPAPERAPDLEAELHGVRSRLWRLENPDEIESALDSIGGQLIIADGHHRYEASRAFHEEEGTEESAYTLAALVSRSDPGLHVFPTHRVVAGAAPVLNGGLSLTELADGVPEAERRLAAVPRDRPAFVLLSDGASVLAEAPAAAGPLDALDTVLVDRLALDGVSFTPSAVEAEDAVQSGRAGAALLVRAPTIEQIEAVARAGRTMPEKSTYFYPKLTSGLLLAPFDE
jgi:uncharacterized protein (DUF1015 family)